MKQKNFIWARSLRTFQNILRFEASKLKLKSKLRMKLRLYDTRSKQESVGTWVQIHNNEELEENVKSQC